MKDIYVFMEYLEAQKLEDSTAKMLQDLFL